MPYTGDPPLQTSTAAAVAASTQAVTASTATAVVTSGVKISGGDKPHLKVSLHAEIHPDAKDWTPLSLRAGGDPGQAENSVLLRQVKSKGKFKGVSSKATGSARVIVSKNDRRLIVSIFPKALEKKRCHFEVRFRVVEGFVEDVKVQAVSVVDPRPGVGLGLDSHALRREGIEFEESSPGSGQINVSALDVRPGKGTFNAGRLKLAEFAGKDLGFTDVSWSVRGLSASK